MCDECSGEYVARHGECRCQERLNNINSYGHKPVPIFWTLDESGARSASVGANIPKRAYFGIELESEAYSGREQAVRIANKVNGLTTASEDIFYLKRDGSLANGFELVTHPRDLGSWHEFADTFADLLSDLSKAGMRCWSVNSPGLHIHVSRDAFASRTHVARFSLLINRNAPSVIKFAGRKSNYARYDAYGETLTKAMHGGGSHSDAVNVTNRETIEVRVFRPSLAVGRVLADIELVAAAMEYTRPVTLGNVAGGALGWDAFTQWCEGKPEYENAVHVMNGGRFYVARSLAQSLSGDKREVNDFAELEN